MATIRPSADASAADWLLAEVPWFELVRFGPPGFDVYLRVSFADTADTAETADTAHTPDTAHTADAMRHAIALLARQTTSTTGYAAVWEGWHSGAPTPIAPELDIPNRRMLLFSGPLLLLRDAPALAWHLPGQGAEPALVWPDDRSWCFACDVDEEVGFTVGCSAAAATLLAQRLPGQVRSIAYGQPLP